MKNIIFYIGRHKTYPYVALILVTLSFLYTDPFSAKGINWRYLTSYFGAVMGLICVILLAKGKISGNIFGMLANFGEGAGNFLGANLGASLPTIYYFCTHIYALGAWRNKQDDTQTVQVRNLHETHFFYILLFFIIAAFINVFLTGIINLDNDPYQMIANCFIFALGVSAQLLMVLRFSFNWLLWILLNILVIGLNIYTKNPIIATQYIIYLFNSTYGYLEWKSRQSQDE